jgi:hypothetical protein
VFEFQTSNVDDKLYRESLTRVLEAWMDILTENEHVPKEMVQPIVTDIFNSYLKAHLSPPEGFRRPVLKMMHFQLFSSPLSSSVYSYNL